MEHITRFASLLLWLLVSSVALQDNINAISQKVDVEQTRSNQESKSDKDLHHKTKIFADTSSRIMKGRKTISEEVEKKEVLEVKIKVAASAQQFATKCGLGSRRSESSSGCEVSKGSPPSSGYVAGFLPFTSDYRSPRSHPPKHN